MWHIKKLPNYFALSGLRSNWDPHHDGLIPLYCGTIAMLFRPSGAVTRSAYSNVTANLLVGEQVSSRRYAVLSEGRIKLNDPA